ncbi:MAG: hypothetical protein ABR95_07620 [Sphingobacteriales bacterium BACL12 MAG-120813-bin55]|nr:MAG: hypothetical protein ABR95_07620 [Sphingobacteriales bacterium BACL12 MAG-120813-bin55]
MSFDFVPQRNTVVSYHKIKTDQREQVKDEREMMIKISVGKDKIYTISLWLQLILSYITCIQKTAILSIWKINLKP